jgi:cell pole-organizing protein PopZ
MNDEQGNQSVKDILEDIKKAISGNNTNNDKASKIEDEQDMLHLDEEYLEDDEGESREEISEQGVEEVAFNDRRFNSENYNLEEKKETFLHNNIKNSIQMSGNKVSHSGLQGENNDHLILKENMEEIKALLGKMQSELQQQQQQKRPNLTVEELVTSLLKPQLSEWLNQHLYKLVKEVVEKELRDIINSSK